jgi:mono/diheme cytochrome c family protein
MRFVLRLMSLVSLTGLSCGIVSGQTDLLEKSVRTILDTKCVVCHGQTRMSDLDLRESKTALAGGKRGPSIVPGNPEVSLLFKAVKGEGELQMPPGKTALTPQEIAVVHD